MLAISFVKYKNSFLLKLLYCLQELFMLSTLTKPSSLIHDIRSEKVDDWLLFKFSDSLQLRMEELLEKKKQDKLTQGESSELEAIGELDRIFTHINAMSAAHPGHS
jgi:hypothetical protein